MPQPFCFIQLRGGLGNQLFQIAAAQAHCLRHGLTLVVPEKTSGGVRETVYWSSFLKSLAGHIGTPGDSPPWCEPHYHFHPIPAEARNLHGYFQSSQHFSDFSGEIQKLFTPADSVIEATRHRHSPLLTGAMIENGVVVHIRRGDYVTLPKIHPTLTHDYYRRAMATCRARMDKPVFLVFSDDPEWCRHQSWLAGAQVVDETDDSVALHLMSRFRHYILSNSSFSWWAAWLGEPATTVVAPDRWFGPDGPQDYQDVYEPSWIRLPVRSPFWSRLLDFLRGFWTTSTKSDNRP